MKHKTAACLFADIFFGHINSARRKSNTVLSEKEIAKLLDETHNRGDWLLFQHFNTTLWDKIAREDNFYEEVKTALFW